MHQILLIATDFNWLSVWSNELDAFNLRREKRAVVTETRSDAAACNGATDSSTHQVMSSTEFESVFGKFVDEVANTDSGLNSGGSSIRINVFDLIETRCVYNSAHR
jgi:hypothetical protein